MSDNISEQFRALVAGQGIGESPEAVQGSKEMAKSASGDHELLHSLSQAAVDWHRAGKSGQPHAGCWQCGKLLPLEKNSSKLPHHDDDFGGSCSTGGEEVTMEDMVGPSKSARGIAANLAAFDTVKENFGPHHPVNPDGSCKSCSRSFPHITGE